MQRRARCWRPQLLFTVFAHGEPESRPRVRSNTSAASVLTPPRHEVRSMAA
jgi:hypothetical protein